MFNLATFIGIKNVLGIVGIFASDLQNGIQQIFQLFGQFISYMINLPTFAWYILSIDFAVNMENYGRIIPIMLVIIFGITGLVSYTIISVSRSVSDFINPEELIEE